MKKSIVYLGIALLGFGSLANAAKNGNLTASKTEVSVYAKYYATPLCVAISKGEIDVVKKFIEYGVNVNEQSNGSTPLMLAARYNKVEILKVLIANGAKADAKDDNGKTALQYAVNSNATEAVAYLKQV